MVSLEDLRKQTDFSYFSKRSGPDPITSNEIIITKQHKEAVEILMHAKDVVMVAYR